MHIEYRSIPGPMLLASDDDLISKCINLYSNHYGIWSDKGVHPGKHIRLSKERLSPWLDSPSAMLYYATCEEQLIGYAIAIRAKSKNFGTISWVTQLVVHNEYRNRGIAKNILFSIWGFSTDDVWGIVSSNPYAIRALEKATRRRATPVRIKRNLKRLKNIGSTYVPYINEDAEIKIDNDNSQINTGFFVSHENTQEMLASVVSENIPWLLGMIDEGWEWFAFTFKDQAQISLTKDEISTMIELSDSVAKNAYESMELDPQHHHWMRHTEAEIDYILNICNVNASACVYDIGCGIGRHTIELAKRGFYCVGVDYVEKNIEVATKKKKELGLENVEFILEDCRSFESKNIADLVLCLYDVIGSFAQERENEKIIKTIHSVLKQNGYAIISVMNYESTLHNAKHIFNFERNPDRLLQLTASNTMEKTGDVFDPDYYIVDECSRVIYRREQFTPEHQLPMELVVRDRRYSMNEIIGLLEKNGFKIIQKKYANASDWNISYSPTDPKAKEILIVCQKI